MLIVEIFETNMSKGVFAKKTILTGIIFYFYKIALDKKWYASISDSLVSTITRRENVHTWLTNQFKFLGIYQASEKFQGKGIASHHCMSFAFDLLHTMQDPYFCNIKYRFHDRAELYLKQNKASKISEENLEVGYLILYKNQMEYMHIAISIGKINGKSYAISKFGEAHNVFIHPIDFVPENYGTLVCFKSTLKLNSEVIAKFEAVKIELNTYLSSVSLEEEKSSHAIHGNVVSQPESEQSRTKQKTEIFIVRHWLKPPSYNLSMFHAIKKPLALTQDSPSTARTCTL